MANKVSKLSNKQKAPIKAKQTSSADDKVADYKQPASTASKMQSGKKMPGFKLVPAVPKQ